jgi:hypothetical protein
MSLNQQINLSRDQPAAARNRLNDQQFHPSLNLGTNGFGTWWNKTSAQHTDVVEQASALMRT